MKIKKVITLVLALLVTQYVLLPVRWGTLGACKDVHAQQNKISVMIELQKKPIEECCCEDNDLLREKLISYQVSIKNEIMKKIGKTNVQFDEAYQQLFNGFSAKINSSDVEKIKKIREVKNVFIQPKLKANGAEIEKIGHKHAIKVLSSVKDYTGKGTAVAILDTGFDIKHEAFKSIRDDIKISKRSIDTLISDNKLNINKEKAKGIYKNSKFPFVYDYTDNDINVTSKKNQLWNHGTYVAGIVGASSDVDEAAKNTQIVAMKVFGNNGELTDLGTVLTALEDAVALNVDAINMSFGEAYGFSSDSIASVQSIFQRVENKGICMSVAAGNDVNTSINSSLNHKVFASNPDISSIASPASDLSAIAVGSVGKRGVLDISSWGTTPDLRLKPDISADGEGVTSCIPNNEYGKLRGTSVSAPYFTSAFLKMKEALSESVAFMEMEDKEKSELCINLLMSSAQPVKNKNGVFEIPRKQGCGKVNFDSALRSKAYIYTDRKEGNRTRPIINLYDDVRKNGDYDFKFYVKSRSNKIEKYMLKFISMVNKIQKDEYGTKFLSETFRNCGEQYEVEYFVNGNRIEKAIEIEPYSTQVIEVKLKMNKQLKKYYDDNFENGQFVEGYILLESMSSRQEDLSIPFLGFYGNWTRAAIFDNASIYERKPYSQTYHALFTDGGKSFLGLNPFDIVARTYRKKEYNPYYWKNEYMSNTLLPDISKIAISPNGDGQFDSLDLIQISLLRNVAKLSCTIEDTNSKTIMQGNCVQERKTYYDYFKRNYCTTIIEPEFSGRNLKGELLKNNQVVKVVIKGELDYSKHKMDNLKRNLVFPVTIDLERPQIIKYALVNKNKKTYLYVRVKDNQFVSNVEIGTYDKTEKFIKYKNKLINEKKRRKETIVKFDISKLKRREKKTELEIRCYDYAMNCKKKLIYGWNNNIV